MNRNRFLVALSLIAALLLISGVASAQGPEPQDTQAALGAGFTYQGQLINQTTDEPAVGTFDFEFALFDSSAGGAQIGTVQSETVTLSGGLFTVQLNDAGQFGASAFTGEARYLEIRVSDDGGANYTTLAPRQPLTAAPYAHSLRPGATISGTGTGGAILNLTKSGSGSGLSVNSTGIGVEVVSAVNGFYVEDATSSGVLVQSATTGVEVNTATGNGVQVVSAATGLSVLSAATGVSVNQASQDGLFVCATGANTTCSPNDSIHSGVEVGNAEHYGLWVTDTGNDGVFIVNAGDDGMQVVAAGDDGIDIQGATDDGVRVRTVGGDGLEVASATDGVHIVAASDDGLQVDSATGAGVRVTAANTGLYVQSASNIGVTVDSALNGIYVISATTWDGYFTGDIRVGSTCTGCLVATFAVNTGDSALQPGDVVALQGTRSGESVGQPLLMEVGPAQAGAPVVGVVYGRGELTDMEGSDDQALTRLAPREGAAQAGEYVHLVIYGPLQVKASAFGSAIQTGDKLAVDDSGAARSLQTRELDGMRITESAPTIGIALEGLEASKDGLIWVLVNPQ